MKNAEKGRKLPVFFTEETFTQMIDQCNQPNHFIAFLLGFESGLRISEVTNLKKEDFDLNNNMIQIRQGKNSKDRVVPLPRDWQPNYIDYIPIGICNRSLQEALYGAIRRAGLDKKLHFHSLRHGYATHLIEEKKFPVRKVSKLLGHQDISTTMVYTHMNPKQLCKDAREAF